MSRRILTINVAMAALLVTACASSPPPPPPPPPPEPPRQNKDTPVERVMRLEELGQMRADSGREQEENRPHPLSDNPARRRAAVPPALCPDQPACIVEIEGAQNYLRQPASGALWARQSTRPLAWVAAHSHCESMGDAWRLPTYAEIDSLFNVNIAEMAECGGLTCRISGLFSLAAPAVWTSERYGPTEMVAMDLNLGTVRPLEERDGERAVALCIKR